MVTVLGVIFVDKLNLGIESDKDNILITFQ